MSGGANPIKYQSYFNIVKVYSISENDWWEAPPLHTPRYGHSSVTLQNYIYAFCGMNGSQNGGTYLNSVERIDADLVITNYYGRSESFDTCWELVETRFGHLTARTFPMVSVVSP